MIPRYLYASSMLVSIGYAADGGTGYFMCTCRIVGTCFLYYLRYFQVTSSVLHVFIGLSLPLRPLTLRYCLGGCILFCHMPTPISNGLLFRRNHPQVSSHVLISNSILVAPLAHLSVCIFYVLEFIVIVSSFCSIQLNICPNVWCPPTTFHRVYDLPR